MAGSCARRLIGGTKGAGMPVLEHLVQAAGIACHGGPAVAGGHIPILRAARRLHARRRLRPSCAACCQGNKKCHVLETITGAQSRLHVTRTAASSVQV